MPIPFSAWAHGPTLDALLDALPFPAAMLDERGAVVATNTRWVGGQRPQALWGAHLSVGTDYADMLGSASTTLPAAFAIRHAVSVANASGTPQHVDYEQAGGVWRARLLPVPHAPGHSICWHEPIKPPAPRAAPQPTSAAPTPSITVRPVSTREYVAAAVPPDIDGATVAGEHRTSSRLDPAREGNACLEAVLAALQVDVSDPLLLLHQAHAGSLMLSSIPNAGPDHGRHIAASQLREAIEEQLRASTAGIAVDWRAIRMGIDACLR